MFLRRLTTKPRGLLRDATLCIALILFEPHGPLTMIGLIFFFLGAGLHFWSKGCLVRNWTVTAIGPYRMVRHPFYLANFLLDVGICMFSGQWWLPALYVGAFSLVYLPTIRKEEEYLTSLHGEAYRAFVTKIPALIPSKLLSLFGPLDFAWINIVREKEISRMMRVLAIPMYFVIVAVLFYELPAIASQRMPVLAASVSVALLLNFGSVVIRKKERQARYALACA